MRFSFMTNSSYKSFEIFFRETLNVFVRAISLEGMHSSMWFSPQRVHLEYIYLWNITMW